MLPSALHTVLLRDLRAVRRQIEAYPDDASVWRTIPGLPNAGGTLALHIAGNVRHFFGAMLGRDGFVRDRDAEFERRDVSRAELLDGVDAAMASVERTLTTLGDDTLSAPYPEPIAKRRIATSQFLVHLATHLAYHLGQLDYHRRAATGDARGMDGVSVRELPEIA
ncbi:MAG: DinB family protein [Gemmatimonadaceae bacterium]